MRYLIFLLFFTSLNLFSGEMTATESGSTFFPDEIVVKATETSRSFKHWDYRDEYSYYFYWKVTISYMIVFADNSTLNLSGNWTERSNSSFTPDLLKHYYENLFVQPGDVLVKSYSPMAEKRSFVLIRDGKALAEFK